MNYSLTGSADFPQNWAIPFIGNNFSLEGAIKVVFVPFCLDWSELFTYKISAKSMENHKNFLFSENRTGACIYTCTCTVFY